MATVKLYEVDPVSRIEGHLGVKVTVDDDTGKITEANAHGNLWRGFENFLIGRRVNDAITFTQRICGVCPVPHGTASTFAADSVLGVSNGYITFAQVDGAGDGVPQAAVLVRNIVLASEFLMSSLTHFYHLVAQSYVQGPPMSPWTPYFPDAQYHDLLKVGTHTLPTGTDGVPNDIWSAVIKQYVKALRIRRLALEAGALFAGRMPMMSMSVAGGTTNRFKDRDDFLAKCDAYRGMLEEVGRFVVSEYIPLALTLSYLYPEYDNVHNSVGAKTGKGYGGGLGNFFAWGAFPETGPLGRLALKGGWVMKDGTSGDLLVDRDSLAGAKDLVESQLTEVITRSRYANTHGYEDGDSAYPGNVQMTEPVRDDDTKYSWLKAPRWKGQPMEVGPLARMVVNGKYFVGGELLVDPTADVDSIPRAYADLYLKSDHSALDATVLHSDLVSGLAGDLGPDAVATVGGHILGLHGGLSTMDRLRGRAIESYWMVNFLIGDYHKGASSDEATFTGGWIDELRGMWTSDTDLVGPKFYRETTPPPGVVSGYGLTEAPRGALGHFVTAAAGKIISYQCVVPTTWNGSPKDGDDSETPIPPDNSGLVHRGAMEQAMIGVPFDATVKIAASGTKREAFSGVEVLRVAQSFDPCIACAVH
jgi:Ni,Fe-hydrogenase I large subunit